MNDVSNKPTKTSDRGVIPDTEELEGAEDNAGVEEYKSEQCEGLAEEKDESSLLKRIEKVIEPAPVPADGSLPTEWVYMRVANVVGVILMILVSLLEFLLSASLSTAILSLYGTAFGCLLCCFELRIRAVASWMVTNFGFMYKSKGRIYFLFVCGMLMWSTGSILGWIVGAYLISLAPANAYILLKYPSLEKKAIDCE